MPSTGRVQQSRLDGYEITVRYTCGSQPLSKEQFSTYFEGEIEPFFDAEELTLIIKKFRNGKLTYLVYKDQYEAYGPKLFSSSDVDSLHFLHNGIKQPVKAEIVQIKKCYIYSPFYKLKNFSDP